MIWNEHHPEADEPDLRALAWRQAADLAMVDAEQAATLLVSYEIAGDADTAARRALALEAARAEAAAELRGQVEARAIYAVHLVEE